MNKSRNLLKTLLTVLSVLSLVGCGSGLQPYPENEVWARTGSRNLCTKLILIDKKKIIFECEKNEEGKCKEFEMSHCEDLIGYKPEVVAGIFRWVREAIGYAEDHCKVK